MKKTLGKLNFFNFKSWLVRMCLSVLFLACAFEQAVWSKNPSDARDTNGTTTEQLAVSSTERDISASPKLSGKSEKIGVSQFAGKLDELYNRINALHQHIKRNEKSASAMLDSVGELKKNLDRYRSSEHASSDAEKKLRNELSKAKKILDETQAFEEENKKLKQEMADTKALCDRLGKLNMQYNGQIALLEAKLSKMKDQPPAKPVITDSPKPAKVENDFSTLKSTRKDTAVSSDSEILLSAVKPIVAENGKDKPESPMVESSAIVEDKPDTKKPAIIVEVSTPFFAIESVTKNASKTLSGLIIAVVPGEDGKHDLAAISIGSNKGVTEKMMFAVMRDGKKLGTLKVTSVGKIESAGVIAPSGSEITEGDIITCE